MADANQVDKRRIYRVRLDGAGPNIQLSLQTNSGEVCEAEIVDLSCGGAGVRFTQQHLPTLGTGERVRLLFRFDGRSSPLAIDAAVRFRFEAEGVRRYGFEFEVPLKPASGPTQRLFRWFNRRHAVRVPVDPGEPILVTLTADSGARCTGSVGELSATGIGVVLEARYGLSWEVGDIVLASMRFPARPQPVDIGARLRRLDTERSTLRVFLEVEPAGSRDFRSQREHIIGYVLERLEQKHQDADG